MARTPRASVSMTSGQGVSRLSYQKSRQLAGGTPSIKGPGKLDLAGGREYSKGKSKGEYPKGINVSYGDTLFPTDLKDIEKFAGGKGR